ncbi:MAG: DUF456 domain-containing protein [Actinomycetota bacterium]
MELSDGQITFAIAAVMVAGLLGTVVPVIPGLVVIWAGSIVYGMVVGFGTVGWFTVGVLTVLLATSFALSVLVPRTMAEGEGVSRWSQLLAVVCAVVGFFLIPVVGVIIGALVGLFVGEFARHREAGAAWGATVAVAKGFGISTLIDIGLGLTMVAVWAYWAFTVLN